MRNELCATHKNIFSARSAKLITNYELRIDLSELRIENSTLRIEKDERKEQCQKQQQMKLY